MGTLYYGECWRTATVLDILRRYIKDESVDLVYLDPPFNSMQNYNAFFQEKDPALAWLGWAVTEQPGKVSDVMQAFYTFLGGNDMMAYLTMMSSRLVERLRSLTHSFRI